LEPLANSAPEVDRTGHRDRAGGEGFHDRPRANSSTAQRERAAVLNVNDRTGGDGRIAEQSDLDIDLTARLRLQLAT
jgi:hypothetical protein